ncbi:hypothetical protein CB1_000909010 [Camelus ferus]|nr:hypothetical protein CB1_000909010 [Camelus ferus]
MQSESGIVPDFEVGEEFHEEPKTYYELKSQPLKSRLDLLAFMTMRLGDLGDGDPILVTLPGEAVSWEYTRYEKKS